MPAVFPGHKIPLHLKNNVSYHFSENYRNKLIFMHPNNYKPPPEKLPQESQDKNYLNKMSLMRSIGYLLLHRGNDSEERNSSSSDEVWRIILEKGNTKKRDLRPRITQYKNVVDRYSDAEFKSHFRLSRNIFNYLHKLIQKDLVRRIAGCPTIPSRQQLMIAIWKVATMDSYRTVCDRFNVGRATAVRAVRRVCYALFIRASSFIQWSKEDRAIDVMCGFERTSGFPKIIGATDGTHIRINAPKLNPADYINRKGFHSIQLQLVVFRLSEIAGYLNEDVAFPENIHILGDTAYKIHQHLLTPYRNNGHLTARVTVERCIGLLKGRMRSLLHCLPMTRVDLMAEYIVACRVIHNICILRENEIMVVTVPESNQLYNGNYSREGRRNTGILKRDFVMNSL
ncbi:hypothetical protein K1T71_008772 [Dendrolimus kikuchii]|uniref:Uncharacterized protein n=1 Tax=Dendrolimus kikuchii TaxID=765133 RepID=A0ACC1CVE2_9NEOP|nr:hypothetical protein K1T71_008772 [Dendrolimus kikuchii]